MPTTTPLNKVNRTKSYGAEVVLYGDVYDEACKKAYELAEQEGYTFIHPFDDLAVATGQGTIAMEIFKAAARGIYSRSDWRRRSCDRRVNAGKAVKSREQGDRRGAGRRKLLQASFAAGKVTTLPAVNTIADGRR